MARDAQSTLARHNEHEGPGALEVAIADKDSSDATAPEVLHVGMMLIEENTIAESNMYKRSIHRSASESKVGTGRPLLQTTRAFVWCDVVDYHCHAAGEAPETLRSTAANHHHQHHMSDNVMIPFDFKGIFVIRHSVILSNVVTGNQAFTTFAPVSP